MTAALITWNTKQSHVCFIFTLLANDSSLFQSFLATLELKYWICRCLHTLQ